MDNKQILEDISKFRNTKETFTIIDENWLGKMQVMILWIECSKKFDDTVILIDMGEFNESFDVMDYKIWLKDLVKARKNFISNQK